MILKFVWNHKRPRTAKAILRRKKKSKRHNPPRLKTILQSYSSQNREVLAQKQTYRPMEQNRVPRKKTPYICSQLIFNKGGKNIK